MTHPAVQLALSRMGDKELRVRMVLDRGDAVAIIVENAQVRQHVIVEKLAGQWETPNYIGGNGIQPPYERPMHASNPPMLSERQITKSGRPQPDGSPPKASWCVVSGVAAFDARIITVTTDGDKQLCRVPGDGFVAALIYGKWEETPRITVETTSGHRWPG